MTYRIDNTTPTNTAGLVQTTTSESENSSAQAGQVIAGELSVLPDPVQRMASGGDMLAELVALLTLASRSDRDAARKAERAEDLVRTQAEQEKVSKMHEEADDIRSGAWASGLAEIGQGLCEVGGAFSTQLACKFDWSDAFKATSIGFKGGGEFASGQFKAMEKLDGADAENASFNADRAGRGSKEAADDIDGARELLKKVVSFYDQMLQAQSAALNAAASFRG